MDRLLSIFATIEFIGIAVVTIIAFELSDKEDKLWQIALRILGSSIVLVIPIAVVSFGIWVIVGVTIFLWDSTDGSIVLTLLSLFLFLGMVGSFLGIGGASGAVATYEVVGLILKKK